MANDSSLRASLGLPTLIALGAAGVVGTSWIYTNGDFFEMYGAGGEILGLVVAAFLAVGVAIAYGELASRLPRAGGEVVYAYVGFGRRTSFVAGWLLIGAYVSSLAFYVTALGELLGDVVPGMGSVPLYGLAGSTVTLPVLAVGIALAVVALVLNLRGVRLGAQAQVVLIVVMLLLGAALAVVGFAAGSPENFWPPFRPDADPVGQTIRFVLPGLTFLTGFGLVAILAEDARLPPRSIRRAVVASVAIASVFYVVVLLASAWVVPWEQTAGTGRGTVDAFTAAGFGVLGTAAYVIALLGLLTSFLALFVATSRIVVAMARADLLPRRFGRLSGARRSPVAALVFTWVVTVVLGLLGPGATTWFLDTGGVYIGLAWAIGVACLFRIVRRRPDLGGRLSPAARVLPALGALAALGVVGFALYPGTSLSLVWPAEYLVLAGWAVLGFVLFLVTRRVDDDAAALARLVGEEGSPTSGTA